MQTPSYAGLSGSASQQTVRARHGAATLSSVNMAATQLAFELEALLHPEVCHSKPTDEAAGTPEAISCKLGEFSKTVDNLERLLGSEMDPQQRNIMNVRLRTYRQRLAEFKATFESRQRRVQRMQAEAESRSELFGERSNEDAEVLRIISDHGNASASLDRSSGMLAQTIELGADVLGSLKEQGSTLRRAQDKLSEIANVLGLSDSLIRVINRREKGDAMIVYGGMVFTVIFLYMIYRLTS